MKRIKDMLLSAYDGNIDNILDLKAQEISLNCPRCGGKIYLPEIYLCSRGQDVVDEIKHLVLILLEETKKAQNQGCEIPKSELYGAIEYFESYMKTGYIWQYQVGFYETAISALKELAEKPCKPQNG